MRKSIICIVVIVVALLGCFFVGRWQGRRDYNNAMVDIVADTTTVAEVVKEIVPPPRDSVVMKYRYVDVPLTPTLSDTLAEMPSSSEVAVIVRGDSAEVSIPITQKVYETEDYRAYISGYNAEMDSIFITRRYTEIKVREPPAQKRFNIGVQAGYGMTPKGFQPYIGIGVSLNLFNF